MMPVGIEEAIERAIVMAKTVQYVLFFDSSMHGLPRPARLPARRPYKLGVNNLYRHCV